MKLLHFCFMCSLSACFFLFSSFFFCFSLVCLSQVSTHPFIWYLFLPFCFPLFSLSFSHSLVIEYSKLSSWKKLSYLVWFEKASFLQLVSFEIRFMNRDSQTRNLHYERIEQLTLMFFKKLFLFLLFFNEFTALFFSNFKLLIGNEDGKNSEKLYDTSNAILIGEQDFDSEKVGTKEETDFFTFFLYNIKNLILKI